jgi:putative glutamine amidotransferase
MTVTLSAARGPSVCSIPVRKPLIGITPSPIRQELPHGSFDRYAMSTNYVEAILVAGGIPLVLPPQDDNATALLEHLDGLLLSGGGDIAPGLYGDPEIHPMTYGVDPLRDRFELDLLAGANARDLPVLCICRGLQVLNVAYGGTLHQDIPSSGLTTQEHRQQKSGLALDAASHVVFAEPDSLLSTVYGTDRIGVNSYHHQVVADVGEGLRIVGRSDDGLVESLVDPARSFVLGVQWHPEMMFETHPEHLHPFRALVQAAAIDSRLVS